MIPILYSATEESFTTLGLGSLTDAISCEAEEERNGSYELVMEYPITGVHYDEIEVRRIILAQPNYTDDPQPFRIYKVAPELNGIVTIYAQHVSYDLTDFAVSPFSATGITDALSGLIDSDNLVDDSDSRLSNVTLDSDISNTSSTFAVDVPSSVRSWFAGKSGSLIDVFGGEWSFDKWDCYLHSARGENRGVKILYGKNLTKLETEKKSSNVYTHMLGYWQDDEGNLVTSDLVEIISGASYVRIRTYDFSESYESTPTAAQLTALCNSYISNNNLSTAAENVKLDFVQLDSLSERVDLCDTVTIAYTDLNVNVTAKCIRTKWDVLKDRYIECEFGDPKNNIASTIKSDSDSLASVKKATSVLDKAVSALSSEVASATGFYVTTATEDDGSTILYMHDQSTIAASTIIAKITAETASWSTDAGSTWNAVVDASGNALFQHLYTVGINASYITSGTMDADLIRTGILRGQSGSSYWNLDTGELHLEGELTEEYNRVFTSTPVVPYYVGDLYITDTGFISGTAGDAIAGYAIVGDEPSDEGGCILVATTARSESESYDATDWELVTTYFDASDVAALQTRITSAEADIDTNAASITLLTESLEEISTTIDEKSVIFYEEPYPPYAVGNLWITGTEDYSAIAGDAIAGDAVAGSGKEIYVCVTEREDGDDFDEDDWLLATDYLRNSDLSNIYSRLTAAEIQLDGQLGMISLKAEQTTVAALANRMTAAEVLIDAQEAEIELKAEATTVTDIATRVTTAEEDIDALEAEIVLKATITDVDDIDDRLTTAEAAITVNATNISSKVETSDYTGATIASLINQSASTVQIEAEHIDLSGSVTVSDFDSDLSDVLVTGVTTKPQYYLSTSYSSATGGSWSDSVPTWSSGYYIWVRSATTKDYADGDTATTYSTAVYDSALTSALTVANSASSLATAAQSTADGKITTYYDTSAPASGADEGDLWIDSNDNHMYRYNGSTWESMQDSEIQTALSDAATAQSTADGKIVTFAASSTPTATDTGDLWIDTGNGNKMYRWSGSAWVDVQDEAILTALTGTSVVPQYYKSTSSSSATGGSWANTIPTWEEGYYLWARTATTVTNGNGTSSTSYSTARYDRNLTIALSTATTAAEDASEAKDTADSVLNRTVQYGTCSTAASTTAKTVTLSDFELYTGAIVSVCFTYANTASSPTLNVNSTGAKSIYYQGAALSSSFYWSASDTVSFVYDGTNWTMITAPSAVSTALSRSIQYGTCSTAASTKAKAVTLSGFVLYTGAMVTVKFTYKNSAASPTLNINSTGAKSIYYQNAALTSSYYWAAQDSITFVYNGSVWIMCNAPASYAETLAESAASTASSAASAASAAQATADSAIVETEICYYRSTSSSTPTFTTSSTIYSTTDTDNVWSYNMSVPKPSRYYFQAFLYTLADGSSAVSTVRALSNANYVGNWANSTDQTKIDGSNIYTGTITTDALEAECVTAAKIDIDDLFAQSITATDLTITGGYINIQTSATDSVIDMYNDLTGTTGLETIISPTAVTKKMYSSGTEIYRAQLSSQNLVLYDYYNSKTGRLSATKLTLADGMFSVAYTQITVTISAGSTEENYETLSLSSGYELVGAAGIYIVSGGENINVYRWLAYSNRYYYGLKNTGSSSATVVLRLFYTMAYTV